MSTKSHPLPYDYKWFNGMTMTNAETDEYNRLSSEIDATYYESSRDALENARHKFVNQCITNHATRARVPFMEIIEQLKEENCFAQDGRLAVYPDWLEMSYIECCVEHKLIIRKHYPHLYSHTDYYLAIP